MKVGTNSVRLKLRSGIFPNFFVNPDALALSWQKRQTPEDSMHPNYGKRKLGKPTPNIPALVNLPAFLPSCLRGNTTSSKADFQNPIPPIPLQTSMINHSNTIYLCESCCPCDFVAKQPAAPEGNNRKRSLVDRLRRIFKHITEC